MPPLRQVITQPNDRAPSLVLALFLISLCLLIVSFAIVYRRRTRDKPSVSKRLGADAGSATCNIQHAACDPRHTAYLVSQTARPLKRSGKDAAAHRPGTYIPSGTHTFCHGGRGAYRWHHTVAHQRR